MIATAEAMVAVCRVAPGRTHARVQINNGEWELITGADLVDLWDKAGGTITIDCVYVDEKAVLEPIQGRVTQE